MLWSAGNQEPMNPAEEADLKKFVGFEMIKSRLCVGALMTGLCLKAMEEWDDLNPRDLKKNKKI